MLSKKEIKLVKECQLHLLQKFSDFCKENNLKYSLYAGTLLGAIRHKGFIPWDDDIDVCMPRQDYADFFRLWKEKGNNEDYFIESSYDYKNTRLNHSKIRIRGTELICDDDVPAIQTEKGIFIDIFPLDYVIKRKPIYSLRLALTRNFVPKNLSFAKKVLLTIILFFLRPFRKSILSSFDKNFKKRNIVESNKLASLGSIWGLSHLFTKTIFDSFIEVQFENYMFNITSEYDVFLKELYGNYMELPPIEKQVPKHSPQSVVFGDVIEKLSIKID